MTCRWSGAYRSSGSVVKIAIVGSGIAGNVAAYTLRQRHEVTVFESNAYIGGHTNTVDVAEREQTLAIDTGFIVFNDRTYPNFIRLLDEIGQQSQPSTMSFSVQVEENSLEYGGSNLNGIFAQRKNLFSLDFHRMLRDILRFNKVAYNDLGESTSGVSVGDYLRIHRYGDDFIDHYLIPMAAAIWSAEPVAVLDMPIEFLVRFFENHGLLQLKDRPQWRVIQGGSREYVAKLVAGHADRIRLSCPVTAIKRFDDRVEITSTAAENEPFDCVVLACHSDEALAMLADASALENETLGAIQYQANEAILHTDASLMPRSKSAWAAWNYHVPISSGSHVAVTYNMNILQSLSTDTQYMVTLNDDRGIDPDKIIRRIQYQHPIYSGQAVAAQSQHAAINKGRTFFCGAYWRNGFHEDGVVSALRACEYLEEGFGGEQLHLRRAS